MVTPWVQTATGKAVDLLHPREEDVDVCDIAEHLAKTARYNGATSASFYSVAQHVVLGADEVKRQTGDDIQAAQFLLHDGHEYALGDDTSPKMQALVAIAEEQYGEEFAAKVRTLLPLLRDRQDAVIYNALGVPRGNYGLVKHFDLCMLETERVQLMRDAPKPWPPTGKQPLDVSIRPWDWQIAAGAFMDRFNRYARKPEAKPALGGSIT